MYEVPYGKTELKFNLLPGMHGTLIHSRSVSPLVDVPAAVENALAQPINSAPLRKLARKGDKACIVFTDITRACPDHLLIPPTTRI